MLVTSNPTFYSLNPVFPSTFSSPPLSTLPTNPSSAALHLPPLRSSPSPLCPRLEDYGLSSVYSPTNWSNSSSAVKKARSVCGDGSRWRLYAALLQAASSVAI